MNIKLFVGNLTKQTSLEELNTLFAQAGKVVLTDIITDRFSGEARGFAFITMSTISEAEKAIDMFNTFNLNGLELKVVKAKSPYQL